MGHIPLGDVRFRRPTAATRASTPGINDKGMVTEDRKTRKDAFYFYKANWNPEPMVYLTSRRAVQTHRCP